MLYEANRSHFPQLCSPATCSPVSYTCSQSQTSSPRSLSPRSIRSIHGAYSRSQLNMQYKMSYNREEPTARPAAKATATAAAAVKPSTTTQKRRHPTCQGVDPDELSQRLLKVLADQKAYADRKRRARAEVERQNAEDSSARSHQKASSSTAKESQPIAPPVQSQAGRSDRERPVTLHLRPRPKSSHGDLTRSKSMKEMSQRRSSRLEPSSSASQPTSEPYHHVPQVAAIQFERTATTEAMSDKHLVHQLSKKALRIPDRTIGTVERSKSKRLRKSQSSREMMQSERVPFERTIALELAVEEEEDNDEEAEHFRPRFRHTFGPTRTGGSSNAHHTMRRMSTGDLHASQDPRRRSEAMTTDNLASYPHQPVTTSTASDALVSGVKEDHRVDWSQRDELQAKIRPRISPLLRKADSIWTLRGRLGSFTKHGKEDKVLLHPDKSGDAVEMAKSPRAGFFARFKR